jgi:hypothetical protein
LERAVDEAKYHKLKSRGLRFESVFTWPGFATHEKLAIKTGRLDAL